MEPKSPPKTLWVLLISVGFVCFGASISVEVGGARLCEIVAGPTWRIASRICQVWPDVTRTTNPANLSCRGILWLVLLIFGHRGGRRSRYHLAILEPADQRDPVGEVVYGMSDAMTLAGLGKTNPKIT